MEKLQLLDGALDYNSRRREVLIEARGIFPALRGFLAAIEKAQNDTTAQRFYKIAVELKKQSGFDDEYKAYMTKRYKGLVPKKGYSQSYIWEFFEKQIKVALFSDNNNIRALARNYRRMQVVAVQGGAVGTEKSTEKENKK